MQPVVLAILDGWGVAPAGPGNPVAAAATPNLQRFIAGYPAMTLRASGEAVGLSWGEMGNSEVGHLTIGAGRVFYQSYPRITLAVQTGAFFDNPELLAAAAHAKAGEGRALHIIGLVSPGNVHGSQEHLEALLRFCREQGVERVFVHAVLDGRDAAQDGAATFVPELERAMKKAHVGQIASVSGRFYAMDRDHRWERTAAAFAAMTGAAERTTRDVADAIKASYAAGVYDEQFVPTAVVDRHGAPVGPIRSGDAVVMTNFRADRAVQLCRAFTEPDFTDFARSPLADLCFVSFTEYEATTRALVAFPAEPVTTCLAKAVADAGMPQLHVAETEKYAHVTYFLNGTREAPFPGEERVIVPSPKVDAYDQVPAMSAAKVGDAIVAAVEGGKFPFIVANFANADMVGHTGSFAATKAGMEEVDRQIGRVAEAVLAAGGALLVTGDHGNAEEVQNLRTGAIDKEHSTNAVPLLVVGAPWAGKAAPSGPAPANGDLSLVPPVGMLADVAPTVLGILGVPVPGEMTGAALVGLD